MARIRKLLKSSLIIIFSFFLSGYGYMGDLPELGKIIEYENSSANLSAQPKTKNSEDKIKPLSIIVPRMSSGYNVNKYSSYLSDIKDIEYLLREIKIILKKDDIKDKVQHFCAKVNLLNLHVNVFKQKYDNKPEKYYKTYEQLIVLDEYLMEIAQYKRSTDKLKSINRGTLKNKIKDEMYLRKQVDNALIPISIVLEIIDETE